MRLGPGFALLLWGLTAWTPCPVAAHGDTPPYIVAWGGFESAEADCQRALGQATRACVEMGARVHRRCMAAKLEGGSCDHARVDEEINALMSLTAPAVLARCDDHIASELYFLALSEMMTDKDLACSHIPEALVETTYAPAIDRDWKTTAAARGCIRASSALAARHLRRTARTAGRALDRLATHDLPPSAVHGIINRTNERIGILRRAAAAAIARACPDFADHYGETVTDLLLEVEVEAHCVTGAPYFQSAFTCPPGFFSPSGTGAALE